MSETSENPKRTALIAEDEPFIRGFIRELLEDLGFEVLEAENGRVAYEMLHESKHLDLLITDIIMPEMDGIALIMASRRQDEEKGSSTKVLAMSGGGKYGKDLYLKNMNALGADSTLEKPFSIQQFHAAIKQMHFN